MYLSLVVRKWLFYKGIVRYVAFCFRHKPRLVRRACAFPGFIQIVYNKHNPTNIAFREFLEKANFRKQLPPGIRSLWYFLRRMSYSRRYNLRFGESSESVTTEMKSRQTFGPDPAARTRA
jgi:hypothetical protein